MKKVLVGDVGGTNTFLGVFDYANNKIIKKCELNTKRDDVLFEISNLLEADEFEGVSLALAGSVFGDVVSLSNVNKKFSRSVLQKKLGIDVFFINDFEALGYYVRGAGVSKGLVVGAGTGLGKTFVYNDVIPSEGGDADFPFHKGEEKLKDFFFKRLRRHPSYEDLVSGEGIVNLNLFHSKNLRKKNVLPEDVFLNKNKLANKKTIRDFSKFYGRFIRNSCLDFFPSEVFVAGGIARKNPWILSSDEFKQELSLNNPCNVKVSLIKDKYAGMMGAGIAFLEKKKN